jgi:hypothetical protein
VNGDLILTDLEALLGRHVAFPGVHARVAVVLWVAHCHALDAFESTPRLSLQSPERGSGKTRTLEMLGLVTPNALHTVNVSSAALYRLVSEKRPTLLLDEADTYLGNHVAKQHEELRGLINAGHRRGATVYRGEVAGKAVNVVEFQAFAACALAGIGDLPDTILDRSIVIPMKRRAPHEHVEAFRDRLVRPGAETLRDRLADWAQRNLEYIRDLWPETPPGITDRAADVWEPLLAMADAAGGEWPQRAREAAVRLHSEKARRDPSLGVQLLADCRNLFQERDVDRMPTETLLEALVALEEAPWGDLRGKPLDARGLARRLVKYGIRPGDHRFHDSVLKGYRIEDFHDAWERYLPPVAHVAHVVLPQGERGAGAEEPHQLEMDRALHLTNQAERATDLPASTPREGQHPQQGQHSRNGRDDDDGWLAHMESIIGEEAAA